MAYAQGTGRHSYEEIAAILNDSLEALSKILGNKKFILGNEPCDDDAAIFGLLAQALYSSPGAPYHATLESNVKLNWRTAESEIHIISENPNLVEYVERMKSIYWPDWDDLLSK